MRRLTDKEFEESGLNQIWRENAFWGDDGYLYTTCYHKAALDNLIPHTEEELNNAPQERMNDQFMKGPKQ